MNFICNSQLMDFMGGYFLKQLMGNYEPVQAIVYCVLQPDSFYFNILPFAEDIRDFPFRSFSSLPPSSQPTEEQQEAADNLVKMLDLAPPGREEILRPDFTPNPMLEVEYCNLLFLLFVLSYYMLFPLILFSDAHLLFFSSEVVAVFLDC